MSVKIVCTADWHIGSSRNGIIDPKTGLPSSVIEALRQVRNVVNTCNQVDADYLLVAGDVFDKSTPTPHHVYLLIKELQRLERTEMVVVGGNHDQGRVPFDHKTPVEAYLAEHDFCLAAPEKASIVNLDGLSVAAIPWQRVAGMSQVDLESNGLRVRIEKLAERLAKKNDPTLLFGHVMLEEIVFNPGKQGSEAHLAPGTLAADVPAQLLQDGPWVAARLGHIHKRQKVTKDVGYIGSIFKVDFGEATERKGVDILTIEENGSYSLKFKPFKVRQLIDLDVSDNDSALDDLLEIVSPGDVVNLTVPGKGIDLKGAPAALVRKVKELESSGALLSLRTKPKEREMTTKNPISSSLSAEAAMRQHIKESDLSTDKQKRAQDMFADVLNSMGE